MEPDRSLGYSGAFAKPDERVDSRAVFGQTMGLVAITVGFFALGVYLGRNITGTQSIILLLVGFIPLIGLQFAVRAGRQSLAVGLLFLFGVLFGFGFGPTLNEYLQAEPSAVYQAGGATALFIAGFGAAGYATSRDLSSLGRVFMWALVALIVFGLVTLFVAIPGANIIYCVLGLVVFAGLTAFDFNRLRRSGIEMAPLLAASIFLDVVNVFLFFLQIFGGGNRS